MIFVDNKFELKECNLKSVEHNEVMIKVEYAALNPYDRTMFAVNVE